MAKEKANTAAKLRKWIGKIANGTAIYTTDGKVIFCEPCQQQAEYSDIFSYKFKLQVPCERFHHLNQHDATTKHKGQLELYNKKKLKQKQQFLTTPASTSTEPDQFSLDLTQAMLSANIPFWKLKNQTFRDFLEKYCGKILPNEKTLRTNYLDICFDQVYL